MDHRVWIYYVSTTPMITIGSQIVAINTRKYGETISRIMEQFAADQLQDLAVSCRWVPYVPPELDEAQ